MSSSSSKLLPIFSLLFIISYITLHSTTVEAQIHDIGFDWASSSSSAMSSAMMYSSGGEDLDLEVDLDVESRRSLYWKRKVYYISYGALSANRVPCPPRSGRSYYTHNCFAAHGPANPYTRGCSCITRCRR
ncbi:protein RALF-like 34 [Chenopodium quinoa]|uniref:protein RALF-like 34 n=1 Tax=Chenopodium quinoa TaxID=63459 RepID=UPI000B79A7E2|nr:protein RALF-like 34 [Chenopodium quinoa]